MWASHCGGFSCCRARALGTPASIVVAHGLSTCGLRALEHRLSGCGHWLSCSTACGYSWTRAQTHVPCIGRWTQPLRHQGSPSPLFVVVFFKIYLFIYFWLSIVFKSAFQLELSHTLFQKKSVPLGRALELSVVKDCLLTWAKSLSYVYGAVMEIVVHFSGGEPLFYRQRSVHGQKPLVLQTFISWHENSTL